METDLKKKTDQYLTFKLAQERYSIKVEDVREVLEKKANLITKIPKTPLYMRGVINVRGNVVPVIDLRQKFGMGETEETVDTSIILLEIELGEEEGSSTIGVLADSVQEVIDLYLAEIEDMPNLGNKVNLDFIAGIGKKGESFILILDTDRILTESEMETVSSVMEKEERKNSKEP